MKEFICILLITFLLCSCNNNHSEIYTITDFSDTLSLKSNFVLSEREHVDKIKIYVKGQVDDTVRLGRYALIPKVVDTVFTHEWYASEYSILFDPKKAQTGELEITVEIIVM